MRPDGKSERALIVIDREGLIRYIRVYPIDELPDNADLFEVLEIIDPQAAANSAHVQTQPQESEIPSGGIVMYCNRWCPDCRKARTWLQERDLSFEEVDIDRVPEAARRVREWSGGYRVTPTFEINGKVVLNFDKPRLEEAIREYLRQG